MAGLAKGTELWNLLPQEHAAALGSTGELGLRGYTTAVFLSPNTAGQLKAVNHWNKALKGALVGHLIRTRPPLSLTWWAGNTPPATGWIPSRSHRSMAFVGSDSFPRADRRTTAVLRHG